MKLDNIVSEELAQRLGELGVSERTIIELGTLLPAIVEGSQFGFKKDYAGWHVYYEGFHEEVADREADARAKMVIFLLEGGLI